MTSTTNQSASFHTYENVVYDDLHSVSSDVSDVNHPKCHHTNYSTRAPITATTTTITQQISAISVPSTSTITSSSSSSSSGAAAAATTIETATTTTTNNCNSNSNSNHHPVLGTNNSNPILTNSNTSSRPSASVSTPNTIASSVIGSSKNGSNVGGCGNPFTKTLADFSPPDSIFSSTIRISSKAVPGQELVTKLITFPAISSMDSIKEWSINSFKCAKQILNEKRGIGSITSDVQLQSDIEQLKNNQHRLIRFLKIAQQMKTHYTNLVNDQKQLTNLMNEMSIKSFQISNINYNSNGQSSSSSGKSSKKLNGKHIVANFSSLGNNLSSTFSSNSTTRHSTQPETSGQPGYMNDLIPIIDHIKSSNVNVTDDFKRSSIVLKTSVQNGERLIAALNCFCSNLSTLIYKTMDDTIATIKQLESVRLDYDAERNSLNSISSSLPYSSMATAYSSDRLELAKARYDQLRIDVQIKMQFLEENTIKVVHRQLALFNSAFTSYSSGNTAALEATLKDFSIKH